MSVVTAVQEEGACRRRLTVEVPAPAVQAETTRVVDEFRRQVRLPGFRKGKTPKEIVRKKFADDIEREVVERLVPRYWRQAEAESELKALLPPRVEDVVFQDEAPLTFAAVIEISPPIEELKLADLDLPESETEPTAEEIDSALEDIRRDLSDWDEVDRPAARGDRVEGKLQRLDGEDGAGEDQEVRFEVGDAQIWEELTLEATGAAAGQKREFKRKQGEGEAASEMEFRLLVELVKERRLPELDDALAKKVGEFDDLEALRDEIRNRMRAGKEQEGRRERESALLDQLRERHPIPLPQQVVEQEVEHLLQDYAESLSRQGVDLQKTDINWQELAEKVRPQGEKRVHARLLLDAVAEELSLEPTAEEFEKALSALARMQNKTSPSLRQELDKAGRLDEFRTQLRRDKVVRHLLGEEERPEEQQESAEEQET